MQSLFQPDLFLQVTSLTPSRSAVILYAIIGLTSIVFGTLTRIRTANPATCLQTRSMLAFVVGLIAMALSVQHLATAKGEFGTGGGRLGSYVSLVLGFIGTILGTLALVRLRRINRTDNITAPTRPGEKT